ncbi:G2/mitotic-specific cyclin, partial [Coemansia sp. RSA 2681]
PAANSQAGSKVSTGSKAQAGENAPAATAKYTTSLVMASLAARKARLPLSSVDATKPQVFRDRTPHVLRAIRAQVAPPAAVADASAVDAPPTKAHDAMRPIRALCAPAESSFNFVAPVADAPLAKAADPSRPIRALGVSASSASNVASAVIAALAAKPVVTRTVVTAELAKPAPLAGQKRRANIAEPERMVRPKISKDVAAPSGLKRRASVVEPERAVQPKLTKESSASTSRSDDAEDKASATLPDSDSADSQATAVELDLPADVKHRRIAKPSRAYSTLRTLAGQVAEAAPAASAAVAKPTEAKAEDEAKRDWDDIDAEDSDDPLMVSEYITDIIDYLREREVVTMPSSTYMGKQKELTWEMRRVLVSWMIQTHYQLRMLPETIFLAVNIIDRFLSKRQVAVAKFQLIGVTALMLACKYEETTTPHIEDFVFLSGNSYTAKEIFNTEVFLLTVLGFDLSFPNPMTFLRRVSKAEDYNMQTRTV